MEKILEINYTRRFKNFLFELDSTAKAKILSRLKRLEMDHWGDAAPIGEGLMELRIHSGPGYRVYCKQVDKKVVIILGGGTKNSQKADIDTAKSDAKFL